MAEKILRCNQCSNHCMADELRCKKGKKYFNELGLKEEKKSVDKANHRNPVRKTGSDKGIKAGKRINKKYKAPDELERLLYAAADVMHKKSKGIKSGIKPAVLAVIAENEGISVKRLYGSINSKEEYTDEAVTALLDKKRIEIREEKIFITEKGRAKLEKERYAGLDAKETEELIRILRKITAGKS